MTALITVLDLGADAVVLAVSYAGDAHHYLHLGLVIKGDGAGVDLYQVVANVFGYGTYEPEWPVVKYHTNALWAGRDL